VACQKQLTGILTVRQAADLNGRQVKTGELRNTFEMISYSRIRNENLFKGKRIPQLVEAGIPQNKPRHLGLRH